MKKAAASALAGAAVCVLIATVVLSARGHLADDEDKPKPPQMSSKQAAKRSGEVRIDREAQERIGIEVESLKAATGHGETVIYGTLEAEPSEEFALHSPMAGFLMTDGSWPVLGSEVAAGKVIGTVRPRLTPLDQLGLEERLASTRSDLEAAKAAAASAMAEAGRIRQLNADDKNASDKNLQEADANAAAAEARVRGAETSAQLIAAALQPESTIAAVSLEIRKGGQVLEVGAQPGEAVESGQLLLRVSRFTRLLARLYVPPGQSVDVLARHATIAPAGRQEQQIPAERVAITGFTDPKFQGQMLLFRLAAGKAELRPGQSVTARISEAGRPAAGVLIPAGAILRFQGEAWVYLQGAPSLFVRRMVSLDHSFGGGWLVSAGFLPGQKIVVAGGQLLLSEEMKSQLETDAE